MSDDIEKTRKIKSHRIYLYAVSLIALAIFVYAVWQIPKIENLFIFLLFLVLGVFTQVAATTATLKSKTGVTYALSPAISLATVPFFGPGAAVMIEAVTSVALWLIKPADETKWKKSWVQLSFNTSSSIIAIFLAGQVFLAAQTFFGDSSFARNVTPWLLAAVTVDQVSLWLIAIMLRLQHGADFKVFSIWRENAWAIPISILTVSVGGGYLAYSYLQFGWTGIAFFFLPLLLSAYAFRLYVSQMQAHMDNLEDIIAERTDTLKDLMREKDSFLAVLTHDMKSPLTTIGIYAGLLRDKPGLLLERPYITETLRQSQQTLLSIVNNILDLEKMQVDGTINLDKEYFDLVLLTDAVVAVLKVQADQKNIEMEFLPMTRSINLLADKNQIERVIHNLVSNAIKYTPDGQHVKVEVCAEKDTAVVQVIDTGYGIPAEELAYVFERYRRVDKHKKMAAGTGLGLAITKALVEAHHGQIFVESVEDQGSQFTIKLPLGE
jgi:signal transduction histidine kinase